MYCLWCDQEIISSVNWGNLMLPPRSLTLCEECEGKLERITGSRCEKCSRKSAEQICSDCQWWSTQKREVLAKNHSIYVYNAFMKEIIAKWKYRGDYVLKKVFEEAFLEAFRKEFGKYKDTVLVPIPLSDARLAERGFNQAEALARQLPIQSKNLLTRTDSEKQSKKSRKQRIAGKNPFIMTETLNKPAILVDDIYTTGTTLRHAAELLRQNGCPKVSSYTLIRG
ncbi:ComF family protein [Oceanobacillus manasiensis]|uniref:ComF family protein n=1 Tax=Oceanobacillus manasiensis TaxID=586413 RepID=UPI000694D4CD|nr:ComF family protein [Oceanobacillus manasiensis]